MLSIYGRMNEFFKGNNWGGWREFELKIIIMVKPCLAGLTKGVKTMLIMTCCFGGSYAVNSDNISSIFFLLTL